MKFFVFCFFLSIKCFSQDCFPLKYSYDDFEGGTFSTKMYGDDFEVPVSYSKIDSLRGNTKKLEVLTSSGSAVMYCFNSKISLLSKKYFSISTFNCADSVFQENEIGGYDPVQVFYDNTARLNCSEFYLKGRLNSIKIGNDSITRSFKKGRLKPFFNTKFETDLYKVSFSKKWRLRDSSSVNEGVDIELLDANKTILSIVSSEGGGVGYCNLVESIENDFLHSYPNTIIEKKEIVRINGFEFYHLNFSYEIFKMVFVFDGIFYSGKSGELKLFTVYEKGSSSNKAVEQLFNSVTIKR